MKRSALSIGALVVLGIALTSPTLVSAAMAGPDAAEPRDVAGLARQIRSDFWSAMDMLTPPVRVRIKSYDARGPHSYVVRLDVYDIFSGPGSRPAIVLAKCWSTGRLFSGGWANAEEEALAQQLQVSSCR